MEGESKGRPCDNQNTGGSDPKLGEWLSLATFVCFSLSKGFLRDVVTAQCCCLSTTKAKADPYAYLQAHSLSTVSSVLVVSQH